MTSKLRTFHTAICSARAGMVSIMFTRSLWSHCTRTLHVRLHWHLHNR